MLVFLRLLPAFTDRRDIGRFVRQAIGPHWYNPFRPKIQIVACDILRITDLDTRLTEYHGLVQLDNPDRDPNALQRLGEAQLNGSKLEVREFHHRSRQRDRRGLAATLKNGLTDRGRRKRGRRRTNLLIEQVSTSDLPQD